jgi:biotin carboxylase
MKPAPPVIRIRLPVSAIASESSREGRGCSIARDVKTVLFVGAGRHQRRAILRARELGLRVVAVDRNPEAAGLAEADAAEVVDFVDLAAVIEVARRHGVDGALTVSADRAVPVVAAVAGELGLPGIGRETAHLMTHKVAMRRRLAEGGVPQPQFAAIRAWREAAAAADTVGFPAVLKPADSGGQRGVFLLRSFADLERHFHAALAESPSGETILEEFTDGLELNGLVVAREGEPYPLLLSDRLRPDGVGFGVGWIHSYPSRLFGDALEEAERVALRAVRTLGLRDGIAFPQLIVTDDGRALVVEVAARIPGGQMADLAFHALGVDLVRIALRQALGEETPDDLVVPRISRPTAIRFLTAHPGPLPLGKVRRIGSLDRVLAAPGVVQADVFLQVGEEIRPVRLDGDRRGYVIATGDTNVQALELAESAALKLYVETE